MLTEQEARDYIASVEWTYAKTMPEVPHWYTVRNTKEPKLFEEFLIYILHWGDLESRGSPNHTARWKRIYLDLDEYYYWWMGAPLRKATVINRARKQT